MKAFSDKVRDGAIRGATGETFTDVVNIGIGGSDLGPAMVTLALAPYTRADLRAPLREQRRWRAHARHAQGPRPQADDVHRRVSKTFTTDETMTNANTARAWIADALGDAAVNDHFAALSTNLKACDAFGIRADRIFGFWDWVGGRYSVWSAIGLPVAIAVGFDNFDEFLAGAYEMDQHFLTTPLETNLPVIMGMLGVWYRNAWGFPTHAVLPYDQRLSPLRRLSPAAGHGEQRQVGEPRRQAARLRDRSDHLGRAGHQRPARVLPADPPGDDGHPLRLPHRRQAARGRCRRTTTSSSPTSSRSPKR